MKYLLIFLFCFSVSSYDEFKHVVPWPESNMEIWKTVVTNADEHPDLNPATYLMMYMFIKESGLKSVTITNSCGRKSFHHGQYCPASDYFFDEYSGRTIRENAKIYVDKLYEMVKVLEKFPSLGNIAGIGVYFPVCINGEWDSNGLIIHNDIRGRKARWARSHGGKYVTIAEGIRQFKQDLRACP